MVGHQVVEHVSSDLADQVDGFDGVDDGAGDDPGGVHELVAGGRARRR
jgi:hypothetical protein